MNEKIPIIIGELRDDLLGGIKFRCKYCKKYHFHGIGEGVRNAHCKDYNSPYYKTNYFLKLNDEDKLKVEEIKQKIKEEEEEDEKD